jgi:hypothetical protein
LDFPEQQPQPGACLPDPDFIGSCRLLSFVVWAMRLALSIPSTAGTVKNALSAGLPQSGQSQEAA